jgi:hypothetical protein
MTKHLLERIERENANVFANIKSLKSWYGTGEREIVLAEIRGFLMGLKLTGFITESEKRCLFCYITL